MNTTKKTCDNEELNKHTQEDAEKLFELKKKGFQILSTRYHRVHGDSEIYIMDFRKVEYADKLADSEYEIDEAENGEWDMRIFDYQVGDILIGLTLEEYQKLAEPNAKSSSKKSIKSEA